MKRFIEERDRGMLLIEAEPGRGKTALLCHLIEHEFGDYNPQPVYFFYRRTAGIADPDVCVKSLYASLLEARKALEEHAEEFDTFCKTGCLFGAFSMFESLDTTDRPRNRSCGV